MGRPATALQHLLEGEVALLKCSSLKTQTPRQEQVSSVGLPVGMLAPFLSPGGGRGTEDLKKLPQGGVCPDRAGSQESVRFSQVAFQPEVGKKK